MSFGRWSNVVARLDGRALARLALDYALVIVGAVCVALAADLFLIPNQVVSGGVVGVATILHYTLGTPVGLATLLINVPLFVVGLRWAGGVRFALRTGLAVVVMSLAIDLLPTYVPRGTAEPLLYTLYGGLLDGLGMGLVFRAGGTTGGTDILAQLLQRFTSFNLGGILLGINVAILGTAAIVFGLEPVLYALIVAYVSSRVIDLVQEGFSQARAALIISGKPDVIRGRVMEELGRGVTVLEGKGGYTAMRREVLYCVVAQSEVTRLKRLVKEADPDAFVVISQALEVLGEGFEVAHGR
jgi:uncharacterized membrane-anchored protein YitT (DUF2179 family)